MRELEDRHVSEIAAMRRLLGIGAHVFVEFEATSRSKLGRVEHMTESGAPESAIIDELMRLVHAVRGDARALGLLELQAILSALEDVLSPVRDAVRARTAVPRDWRATTLESIVSAREALSRARQRLVAASTLGEAVFDQVTVSARDLVQLAALRSRCEPAVQQCVDRLRARPFAEIATGLDEVVASWAATQGKRARLEIVGATVRVDPTLAGALRTAVVQLVRNAIAHGIETPDVRRERNKPVAGRIVLRCSDDGGGIVVEVEDDGGGVAASILRDRCAPSTRSVPDEELPFLDGVSTRDRADDLAGRGVGLSAVRSELATVGFGVTLTTAPAQGTKLRITRLAANRASA
jgi:chemotaxis protein histidine kinase CheA